MGQTASEFYGTGKRKSAIARVHLRPGSGEMKLNGRSLEEYFGGHEALKMIVRQPLVLTENGERFDILASLQGGGVAAQAGALRHGITRALCVFDMELRGTLKKAGLITRDARIKERKKYGQRGARRRFQFSKR